METKGKGEVSVSLAEGDYLIKNVSTPVSPLLETHVTLEAGKE
ncbi:hypothetical protein [Pseudoalteromonas sp. NBT06-2]|nr:hypothetical protein [Pseudoalteromonas sp. NBT06-2]